MGNIDLKVGYSCNDACLHCVVDDCRDILAERHEKQDKSFAEIAEEMRNARQRGDTLTLTGGEPSIRRDFPEIIALAAELGFSVLVQSNGRAFCHRPLCEKIAQYKQLTFCIALHGPEAAIHERVTQRPGSFAETLAGIKNLHECGLEVSGKIVLSRLNYERLEAIIELLHQLQVKSVNIAFPHAQGRARKLWDEVVPRYQDLAPYLFKALLKASTLKMMATTETIPFCFMEGFEHCVAEIGQQIVDYSEINQYGLNVGPDNWSKLRLTIKEKFPNCTMCRFDPICEGPWNEYARRYGGEEFHPLPGRRLTNVMEIINGTFREEGGRLQQFF